MNAPACWGWPVPTELDHGRPRATLWNWHADRCAVCGELNVNKPFHLPLVEDHCHATGLVRGWLCRGCNTKEGLRAHRNTPIFMQYRARPAAAILGTRYEYYLHQQNLRKVARDAARALSTSQNMETV